MRFDPSKYTASGDPLKPENIRLPASIRVSARELARRWRVSLADAYRRLLERGIAAETDAGASDGDAAA
ncbi:MAG: hypothetical protein R3B90_21820 [Planctomycetaceae bacterium]